MSKDSYDRHFKRMRTTKSNFIGDLVARSDTYTYGWHMHIYSQILTSATAMNISSATIMLLLLLLKCN